MTRDIEDRLAHYARTLDRATDADLELRPELASYPSRPSPWLRSVGVAALVGMGIGAVAFAITERDPQALANSAEDQASTVAASPTTAGTTPPAVIATDALPPTPEISGCGS